MGLEDRRGSKARGAHRVSRRAGVSFSLGRLEPQLGSALAAFTAWMALCLAPASLSTWLVALAALCTSAWAQRFPATHQWQLAGRGLLMLCAGFLLHLEVGDAAPQAPVFLWPTIVTMVYALLLQRSLALALAGCAAALFAAGVALTHTPGVGPALVQGSALVFFPYLAMRFGREVREMDHHAETARLDRRSQLYNEAGFFSHGTTLFEECRHKKRPFALVLLNSADLREAADLAGRKAAGRLFAQLVERLAKATPPGALAARTDSVEFCIALPGFSAERAGALLRQELGEPPKVQLQAGGGQITVILDAIVAEATPEVPALEDFYDRMHSRLYRRLKAPLQLPASTSSAPLERGSTLLGLLDDDGPIPHHDRPTMPMPIGDR